MMSFKTIADIDESRLKTHNRKDYRSVILGCVHNVGAGGVMAIGCADVSKMNSKRFIQWDHRMCRAVGLLNYDT